MSFITITGYGTGEVETINVNHILNFHPIQEADKTLLKEEKPNALLPNTAISMLGGTEIGATETYTEVMALVTKVTTTH